MVNVRCLLLCAPLSVAQDLFLEQRVAGGDAWDKVRQAMDKFPLIHEAMLTVGDASGELFNYAIGGVTRDTEMDMYSSTKWVAGVAMMREYERGVVELDAPVSKYLDYWTTDPSDSRSSITLRHLLGFSDGYTDISQMKGFIEPLSCVTSDLKGCARAVYDHVKHEHAPGSIIDYNSIHLTLAGAVVESAVGERMIDIISRNVFQPVGMTNKTYFGVGSGRDDFPFLAGGLVSTPQEYGAFTGAFFRNELISQATRSEMFSNAFPSAKKHGLFLLEHTRYGLTTWYECPRMINLKPWDFTPECAAAHIHACDGASGSYPIIDLHNEYYYHFAYDGLAGLGAAISGVFRDTLKPLVDAAIAGTNVDAPLEVPTDRIACLETAMKEEWVKDTDGLVVAAELQC